MNRILLVEPDYPNKYPPIGLMKLSTYHKSKNDKVEFYKGKAPYTFLKKVDRVYITTLFTFYYDITIDTIRHYMDYVNHDQIYVGGIASTLLFHDFHKDTGLKNILTGQLINSSLLGYDDNTNIDNLSLDYDILDDISYKYPAGDNYFIYTTRGCPRKCDFCAVSTLEPKFKETNHIVQQISNIKERYGDKRNVLIMDNNILFSRNLRQTVNDLNLMGFKNDTANFVYPNPLVIYLKKMIRRKENNNSTDNLETELYEYLISFKTKVRGSENISEFNRILNEISEANVFEVVINNQIKLTNIIEKYRFKRPLQRFVDFNQGADARLLTREKMNDIKDIPISPFRLAYDALSETESYLKAFHIAYDFGVRHFSNYILYNYRDRPEDLWTRLHNSVELFSKKDDVKAFSFPMKYAPIQKTRDYVGVKWNKKFLSAVNIIINVTGGSVAKEKDFFYKAYGSNETNFIQILTMPNEFIKHRFLFENNGLASLWQFEYDKLDLKSKQDLVNVLSGEENVCENNNNLIDIMRFYSITKNKALKVAAAYRVELLSLDHFIDPT